MHFSCSQVEFRGRQEVPWRSRRCSSSARRTSVAEKEKNYASGQGSRARIWNTRGIYYIYNIIPQAGESSLCARHFSRRSISMKTNYSAIADPIIIHNNIISDIVPLVYYILPHLCMPKRYRTYIIVADSKVRDMWNGTIIRPRYCCIQNISLSFPHHPPI